MSIYRNLAFVMTGTFKFTKQGYLAAAKQFDKAVMERSLQGKVVMITGANAGLGFTASEVSLGRSFGAHNAAAMPCSCCAFSNVNPREHLFHSKS